MVADAGQILVTSSSSALNSSVDTNLSYWWIRLHKDDLDRSRCYAASYSGRPKSSHCLGKTINWLIRLWDLSIKSINQSLQPTTDQINDQFRDEFDATVVNGYRPTELTTDGRTRLFTELLRRNCEPPLKRILCKESGRRFTKKKQHNGPIVNQFM